MTQLQLAPVVPWVPIQSFARLVLALGVGLFVGLEREWRGKEAGLRTFGLVSLLGAIGGMLGPSYALVAFALIGILIVFLNIQGMKMQQGTELTTSASLLVMALSGVLCGLGHTVTPVAVAVVTAGILSSKERLSDFGHKLTAEELRSAILLGILAFAIYPMLPEAPVDPWGLVAPRAAWITVILIAAIGFVNYIMWKIFGTKGIEFAGFLGGLVNSTVTATELSTRVEPDSVSFAQVAFRGLVLSIAAMAVRNAVILGVVKPSALALAGASLGLMLIASLAIAFLSRRPPAADEEEKPLTLKSPFSLKSALKFGVIFVALQVAGALAQTFLGRFGFYVVSFVGGLVSSASAVAAAAMLASHGQISPVMAGNGATVASLASAAVNFALVARVSRSKLLVRKIGIATVQIVSVGLVAALATELVFKNH